jgi:hypothetical protein
MNGAQTANRRDCFQRTNLVRTNSPATSKQRKNKKMKHNKANDTSLLTPWPALLVAFAISRMPSLPFASGGSITVPTTPFQP